MSQLVNAKDYIRRQLHIDFKGLIYCMRCHCNRFRNVEKLARFSLACDIFLFFLEKGVYGMMV